MTIFNISPDDLAIRNLITSRRKPAGMTPLVDPVPATPVVHAPENEPVESVTQYTARQLEDRRAQERRKQQQKVLLDTRAKRERRQLEANSDSESPPATPLGIDIQV